MKRERLLVVWLTAGTMLTAGSEVSAQCDASETWEIEELSLDQTSEYGSAVAMDTQHMIVGAPWADGGGSVIVYERIGEGLVYRQTLVGPPGVLFGSRLAIDSDVLVVGAVPINTNACDGMSQCGSAYVFRHDGSEWVEEQELVPSDFNAASFGGAGLSVSNETIMVGSSGGVTFNTDGQVFVFRWSDEQSAWTETQEIVAPELDTQAFGHDVAVSDGLAVIGAISSDVPGSASGEAYVYRYDGASWQLEWTLEPEDLEGGDRFGYSVAIEGELVLVGSIYDDDAEQDAGAVYVFRYDEKLLSWVQEAKLLPADGPEEAEMGRSAALMDGYALLGACGGQAIHVFEYTLSGWQQVAKLVRSVDEGFVSFGCSLGAASGMAVVGAPLWENGRGGGWAYVYGGLEDCNGTGTLDICDIDDGTSIDADEDGIPDDCQGCTADTDGNGSVDVDDLIAVVLAWGTDGAATNTDVDGSGLVDVDDLLAIILAWGPCS